MRFTTVTLALWLNALASAMVIPKAAGAAEVAGLTLPRNEDGPPGQGIEKRNIIYDIEGRSAKPDYPAPGPNPKHKPCPSC